jgi:secreted PhoX family phosphatase
MPTGRRAFLRQAALLAAAPSLAGLLAACARRDGAGWPPGLVPTGTRGTGRGDYGPLARAGPELALPSGFRYVTLSRAGDPLSGGGVVPAMHDGMACFATAMPGVVRLVRNHELAADIEVPALARANGDPSRAYDPLAPGGTTTLELRLHANRPPELLRAWLSLGGTLLNCAGGPTPWGSWLSCEETVMGRVHGYEREHGYVFEVLAGAEAQVEPVPLTALGRFVHEAVAVDPRSDVVYLTEDQLEAGFYRFVPRARGRMRVGALREGGTLQMLALRDVRAYDTRRGQYAGVAHAVRWVDIPEPDPAVVRTDTVRAQGLAAGAATFGRLEGAWWGDGGVYFHSTNGGDAGLGQLWRYRPGTDLTGGPTDDGGELMLVYESRERDVLQAPDNVTVSPRGGIVICEDASGVSHLRGLSPKGEIFPFARNLLNGREFAGACFSPDGRVLFVNAQGDPAPRDDSRRGRTFAIWGPWERGGL